MHYRIALNSCILPRATVRAGVQGGRRIHYAAHTTTTRRTLATIGSRPATDQAQTPPDPKTKWRPDRETLYIGGGLAAIGALWYYYATMENARIERRRLGGRQRSTPDSESDHPGVANVGATAANATKRTAQEASKNAQ